MPAAESGRHDAQMLTSTKATALSTPTSTNPFIPYDTAFGIGGRVADYAPSFLYRLDLNQLGDSAILLAGYRRNDPQAPLQLALARYHADGRADTSFGEDGIAVVSGSPTVATLPNVRTTVQPDGKIVVATVFQLASQEQRWAMSRLTAAGQLDPTFSGDGKLQISFPDAPRGLHLAAVLVRADGTILVVGSQGSRLCAARYRLNGSLDLSFGVDGKLVTGLPGDRATVLSAALDAVGNVVVVGLTTMPDSGADMLIGRLHPDGTPDEDFGLAGFVIEDFGIRADVGSRTVVQADDRILVAGTADVSSTGSEPALLRLLPDGSLDPSFGVDGRVRLSLGKEPDRAQVTALGLLPGGRIAVAGSYQITDSDRKADPLYRVPQPFVAVRRQDGTPDPAFHPQLGVVFLGSGSATSPTDLVVTGDKVLVAADRALVRLNTATTFSALRLSIGVDANSAGPGPLHFFVTVHNDGESGASGLLRMRSSQAVSVVAGTGGSYSVAPNRMDVTGKVTAIPAGGTATLTLRTTVNGFEEGISLTGSINDGQPELNTSDNHAAIMVTTSRLPTA